MNDLIISIFGTKWAVILFLFVLPGIYFIYYALFDLGTSKKKPDNPWNKLHDDLEKAKLKAQSEKAKEERRSHA